ncbi:hypothetical protein COU74_01055 [Candidatus Peregrinibacteria bacterium CG10_big_fil_rev_8_21_14_0_10_36_19]|nr:MAG: hypothetical protein COU74_01055 [Candidatus Peregrinibacteria bacterium CG10_big_fil_rev_8_21_14_0_10_36_19]
MSIKLGCRDEHFEQNFKLPKIGEEIEVIELQHSLFDSYYKLGISECGENDENNYVEYSQKLISELWYALRDVVMDHSVIVLNPVFPEKEELIISDEEVGFILDRISKMVQAILSGSYNSILEVRPNPIQTVKDYFRIYSRSGDSFVKVKTTSRRKPTEICVDEGEYFLGENNYVGNFNEKKLQVTISDFREKLETLFDLLYDCKIEDPEILKLFRDAVIAVKNGLHSVGVVHGDFKLTNIAVIDKKAKLFDLESSFKSGELGIVPQTKSFSLFSYLQKPIEELKDIFAVDNVAIAISLLDMLAVLSNDNDKIKQFMENLHQCACEPCDYGIYSRKSLADTIQKDFFCFIPDKYADLKPVIYSLIAGEDEYGIDDAIKDLDAFIAKITSTPPPHHSLHPVVQEI